MGWPREIRTALRWVNRRRSLSTVIHAWRELLPGDSAFGDPLSTTGSDPTRVLARQAWAANEGRWSVLAEAGLALLQVADWASEDIRASRREDQVAILFTDLVGFSSWALEAGDEQSLKALREIDAVVSAVVERHDGGVVKRLGDGTMAVFPDASAALEAACAAIDETRGVRVDGYTANLRAGLHFGTPQPIGADYIGIDVNVAARLCEASEANQVLVSGDLHEQLNGDGDRLERRAAEDLDGVPSGLPLYRIAVG